MKTAPLCLRSECPCARAFAAARASYRAAEGSPPCLVLISATPEAVCPNLELFDSRSAEGIRSTEQDAFALTGQRVPPACRLSSSCRCHFTPTIMMTSGGVAGCFTGRATESRIRAQFSLQRESFNSAPSLMPLRRALFAEVCDDLRGGDVNQISEASSTSSRSSSDASSTFACQTRFTELIESVRVSRVRVDGLLHAIERSYGVLRGVAAASGSLSRLPKIENAIAYQSIEPLRVAVLTLF